MTNREKCELLNYDMDDMLEASDGVRCEICNAEIDKNLDPQNPACEGRWCEEALELWLDKEADGDEL